MVHSRDMNKQILDNLELGQSGTWTIWNLNLTGSWTNRNLDKQELGQTGTWTIWILNNLGLEQTILRQSGT